MSDTKLPWQVWNDVPHPDGLTILDPDGFRHGKPTIVTWAEFERARMECTMGGWSAAPATPPTDDLGAVAVSWARFTSADVRTALKNLRGPVDRDESMVMAAADLYASLMERLAARLSAADHDAIVRTK
jgi:hypothetical protein